MAAVVSSFYILSLVFLVDSTRSSLLIASEFGGVCWEIIRVGFSRFRVRLLTAGESWEREEGEAEGGDGRCSSSV